MQFIEAKRKLKRLAKGRYHSVKFELAEFPKRVSKERFETMCGIYIEGEDYFTGLTFKDAFKDREDALKPKVTEEIPQDLPDGESSR